MRAFPSAANNLYKNAMEVLKDEEIREHALVMQRRVRSDIGVKGAAQRIEMFMCEK